MTFRPVPQYQDKLWYPILVKPRGGGGCIIVEMQGKEVNAWNDMVRRQCEKDSPRVMS